mmetsp:Transcript_8536/g.12591  ORF Transcript_8536/g.12591 Transcript_8536/m.12591 type:complete len:150 (-) Transcript_8536:19-468(-)
MKLNDDEIEELKEIFNLVDTDGSGEIDKHELGSLLNTLGIHPSKEELDSMMEEVDADGSGEIDFGEFCAVMATKVESAYTAEEVKVAFKLFQERNAEKGWIKTTQLEKALMTYGNPPCSEDEAMDLIKSLDPDGTGRINFALEVDRALD